VFGTGQQIRVTYNNGNRSALQLYPTLPFLLVKTDVHNPGIVEQILDQIIPVQFNVDLDRSPDLGGPYQAIVMNYVIEHFVSPEAVLRACRAALAPGGRVLLLTPNAHALCHRVFGRYWSGLHAPRHTQIFSPENLQLLASKVGFRDLEVVPSTDPASWSLSFQNLMQRLGSPDKPPRAGTAWYSLALLPAWYPFALAERLFGRTSSMFGILTS